MSTLQDQREARIEQPFYGNRKKHAERLHLTMSNLRNVSQEDRKERKILIRENAEQRQN